MSLLGHLHHRSMRQISIAVYFVNAELQRVLEWMIKCCIMNTQMPNVYSDVCSCQMTDSKLRRTLYRQYELGMSVEHSHATAALILLYNGRTDDCIIKCDIN